MYDLYFGVWIFCSFSNGFQFFFMFKWLSLMTSSPSPPLLIIIFAYMLYLCDFPFDSLGCQSSGLCNFIIFALEGKWVLCVFFALSYCYLCAEKVVLCIVNNFIYYYIAFYLSFVPRSDFHAFCSVELEFTAVVGWLDTN